MTPAAVLLAVAVAVADWGPVRVDAEGVPLPPGVAARLGSTRFRYSGDCVDLRFTPDGRHVVAATTRSVYVWDANTGLRVATHGGFRRITNLAVRPDGSVVVLADKGENLCYLRLDPLTGRELERHAIKDDHDDIVLSPDGRRVAQRFGGLVKVHDAADWSIVGDFRYSISDISPNHFLFSPDGQHLAAVFSNNWTEVREVATGNMPYAGLAEGLESDVQEIAFAPDGRELLRLVHTNGKPYRLESIDLKTEKVRKVMEFENPGKRRGGLMASPDGKAIYFAAQDEVTRFDLQAKRQTAQHRIPFPNIVGRAACSPDGKRIAAALWNSSILLFDATALTKLPQSSDGIVTRYEFGRFVAGGKRLALPGVGSLQVLDAATGAVVGQFGEPGEVRVEVHPDGLRYARSTLKTVEIRDLGTDRVRHSFPWESANPINPAFPSNGRHLCGNNLEEFRMWDCATGATVATLLAPNSMMFPRPDGRSGIKVKMIDGDTDSVELDLVNLATGDRLPRWSTQRFESMPGAWNPNFQTVLVQLGRSRFGLFDLDECRTTWQRPLSRSGLESSIFSPDGRTIAIRSRRSMQLLEASTGRLRHSIPSLESQRPLAFSPDGKHLAAIGPTAPLYLWDVRGALKNYPAKLDRPTTEAHWKDLLADDAEAAFLALRRLAAAPETTLPFVRATVRPAIAPDKEKVEAWIKALDAPAFRDREAAMKELKKNADTVAVELRAARDATPSPEVHERLVKILATVYPETSESVRRTRVVELVEWCGTPDAKRLLGEWSAGAKGALLTAEATATLARLRE